MKIKPKCFDFKFDDSKLKKLIQFKETLLEEN